MTLRLKGLVLGLSVGLAGMLAGLSPQGSSLEEAFGLPWLFALRGVKRPPDDVVVVAIDRESADKLGLPPKPSAWPRSLHARLIDTLSRAGAKVIAFDLTFDTPSRAAQDDEALADSMRRANNVVLVSSLHQSPLPTAAGRAPPGGGHTLERLAEPLPMLREAAAAYVPFPLPKAARVSAYWAFVDSAGDSPSLPAAAFQLYAIGTYGDLLASWRRSDPARAGQAASSAAVVTGHALVPSMLSLRNALANDPTLVRRMAEDLGSEAGPMRLPAEQRLRASLLRLYSGDGGRYLDYYGPPRTVKTVPYYQVLRSPQSVDLSVRGKAVFVGFSAALPSEQDPIRDDYRTVFSRPDGLDLSGVEIAATAFANLVEDRDVRPIEFPWNLFLVLSWGFALGVVCRSVRTAAAVACVVLAGVIYALTARQQFAAAGLWLPLVVPLCLQPALAMFGGLWLRYREAGGERELIKRIFGYYLPEHVVDRLARNVGPLTSDSQVVFGVCLATDAERYTTLSETMEPGQIAALMNDYYAALFEPVERHGGIVSDVVGDAMLATWAGSSAERSLRNRACHAALDIAEAVRQFGAGGERSMIPTRIGLHSGRMLLGNIGASRHFEYRAVGDIVNTATRIEGLGKYVGSRLLVSEDVLDGLDEFLARPLGSFLLAGKTQPVRVSELLGRRADASDRHQWLCCRFALALDAYRKQRWIEAGELLAEILAAFPEDGPAWFFLGRCEHLAAHPPQAPWDATIRFEAK